MSTIPDLFVCAAWSPAADRERAEFPQRCKPRRFGVGVFVSHGCQRCECQSFLPDGSGTAKSGPSTTMAWPAPP